MKYLITLSALFIFILLSGCDEKRTEVSEDQLAGY